MPAGKTTLLDVLAGRKTQGEESGRILFAGQKPSKPFLKRFTGSYIATLSFHTDCAPMPRTFCASSAYPVPVLTILILMLFVVLRLLYDHTWLY